MLIHWVQIVRNTGYRYVKLAGLTRQSSMGNTRAIHRAHTTPYTSQHHEVGAKLCPMFGFGLYSPPPPEKYPVSKGMPGPSSKDLGTRKMSTAPLLALPGMREYLQGCVLWGTGVFGRV